MRMHITFRVLVLAVAFSSLTLTACSSSNRYKHTRSEERVVAEKIKASAPRTSLAESETRAASASAAPLSSAQKGAMAALRDPDEGLSDVFFALDRYTLSKEALEVVRRNGYLLRATSAWELEIEGHCDERGSSAYNMVLGERRAKAVREALADLGIPADRIDITSYGEERPFCDEHTERCFGKNRRAHFVIRGKDG